jgi:hypothetical protein
MMSVVTLSVVMLNAFLNTQRACVRFHTSMTCTVGLIDCDATKKYSLLFIENTSFLPSADTEPLSYDLVDARHV